MGLGLLERLFPSDRSTHASDGELPLPAELVRLYDGPLTLPRDCLFANFVASVDGVVALPRAEESGGIISGKDAGDRFVMALLRACADAIVVGAGTFRKGGGGTWVAEGLDPGRSALYADLRTRLRLGPRPRLVVVTRSGALDLSHPALRDAWIVTGPTGEASLRPRLPAGASTRFVVTDDESGRCAAALATLRREGLTRILTEGGPSLFGELVGQRLVDELFLSVAPKMFGHFATDGRKALVAGVDLAGVPVTLRSVHRHESLLFLRYGLKA